MADSIHLSKLDVSFAAHSIYNMRWFEADLPKDETNFLLWIVMRSENKDLQIVLAANPVLYPNSIEDEIDGIRFYWVGKKEDVDIVRDNYCIDYDPDIGKKKTHRPTFLRMPWQIHRV